MVSSTSEKLPTRETQSLEGIRAMKYFHKSGVLVVVENPGVLVSDIIKESFLDRIACRVVVLREFICLVEKENNLRTLAQTIYIVLHVFYSQRISCANILSAAPVLFAEEHPFFTVGGVDDLLDIGGEGAIRLLGFKIVFARSFENLT